MTFPNPSRMRNEKGTSCQVNACAARRGWRGCVYVKKAADGLDEGMRWMDVVMVIQ